MQRRRGCVDGTRTGSTAGAGAATPRWIMLVQISDGDVLLLADEGATERALLDDPRWEGRTLSSCQPNMWNKARVRVIDEQPVPQLLMLSTDG
jgi:hypothetical protein